MKGNPIGQIASRRQGTDNLSIFLEQIGQTPQILIETGQIEIDLDFQQEFFVFQIFLKAMFFVFGQNPENFRIDGESGTWRVGCPAVAGQKLFNPGAQRSQIEGESRILRFAIHQTRQSLEAIGQQGHQTTVQGHLAETQIIEQVFQLMRQGGHIVEPEHAGQPLEGMGATKNPVEQIGIAAPIVGAIFQRDQIIVQIFNDFLGFPEKIADRLRR